MPESTVTPENAFNLICKGILHFDRNNAPIFEIGTNYRLEEMKEIIKCVHDNFNGSIRKYFHLLTEGDEYFSLVNVTRLLLQKNNIEGLEECCDKANAIVPSEESIASAFVMLYAMDKLKDSRLPYDKKSIIADKKSGLKEKISQHLKVQLLVSEDPKKLFTELSKKNLSKKNSRKKIPLYLINEVKTMTIHLCVEGMPSDGLNENLMDFIKENIDDLNIDDLNKMFRVYEEKGDHDQMQIYAEKIAVKDNVNIDDIISQPSLTSVLKHNGPGIRALNEALNQEVKTGSEFPLFTECINNPSFMRQYLEQRTFRNNLKQYEKGKWPLISQTIEQQSADTRVTGFRNRVLELSILQNKGQDIGDLHKRIDIMRCVYQLNKICVTNQYVKERIDKAITSIKEDIEKVFKHPDVEPNIKVTLLREYIGLQQQYKFDNGITFDEIFDQEGILGSLQQSSEATYELASYLSKEKDIIGSIDKKLNTAKKGKIDMKIFNYFKRLKRHCLKFLKNKFGYGGFTKVVQEKIANAVDPAQINSSNKENKGPQNTR